MRYNHPMKRRPIPGTDLQVSPLCLGGNVFGWTADERASFEVLDAYVAAGGNMIDTSDIYSSWAPGNLGGESETMIGRWMKARGNRAQLAIATKVGVWKPLTGLGEATIAAGIDGSLHRLGTDYVDLYYAHADDETTPLEETMRGFDRVVRAGKARHLAASNYSAARLAEALRVSAAGGTARFAALQVEYSLLSRTTFEGERAALCAREGLGCLPYYVLASGFLTGKYQRGAKVDSARAARVAQFDAPRSWRILTAVEAIARAHGAPVAAVAIAWAAAQPGIVAPIVSATSAAQLAELLRFADLVLAPDELAALATASELRPGETSL